MASAQACDWMSALLPPRSCGLSLSLSRMRQRKGDVFQIRCGEESDVVLFAPRARGRRRPSVLKTRNCISASGQPRVSKDGDNVHMMKHASHPRRTGSKGSKSWRPASSQVHAHATARSRDDVAPQPVSIKVSGLYYNPSCAWAGP
jgi:hypothetical protein